VVESGLEVRWDGIPVLFLNGFKAYCYFSTPLAPSWNVLYYYYIVKICTACVTPF
jgi:hypothetical protein